jgi:BMFP domain-containing protein YqiC
LTKAVERIITEDSWESLRKRIVELEAENSWLKAATAESYETIDMLQRSVYAGIEDYNLLQEGNKSLLTEHNELHYHPEGLESVLAKVRSSAAEDIAALEARIRSAEAHSVDVAATSEKCLRDFDRGM